MSHANPLRILFVEDLPSDTELAERLIRTNGFEITSLRVDTKDAFLRALEEFQPDVIVSDYMMPEFDGMQALKLSLERDSTLPFIILTGSMNEETAVECLKSGATNYVIKEHIARLPFAIQDALQQKEVRIARDKAERALERSEGRFRAITDTAVDSIITLDETGFIVGWNQGATRTFGYTEKEIMGHTLEALMPEKYHGGHKNGLSRVRQGGVPRIIGTTVEMEGKRKDGSEFPLELSMAQWDSTEGRFFSGIIRDITERKRAEVALRESESKYRELVEHASDGIMIADQKGVILLVNARCCEMLGYREEELIGMNVSETYNEDEKPKGNERRAKAAEGQSLQYERPMKRKDGSTFPVEVSLRSLPAGRIQGIIRDITERKRTEREISMLASALKSIKECVSITDLEDIILFVNRSFVETYGYSESELIGQNIDFVRSPNNPRDLVQDILPATLKGGWQGVALNRRKDGSEFPILLSTTSILGENGQTIALIGVASDITERKRVELELMKLHKAIDASEESIFLTDRDGMFTMINPGFTRLYGYTAAEVVGKTTPRILKSGRMKPKDYEIFWQTLLNKEVVKGELFNKTKDGRLVTVEVSANAILDDSKSIIGFLGIQRDITERKKAEEQHKQLQLQLNQAQKLESIGTLAGGIAHDFNNILGIIMAYSSLVQHGKLGAKELPDAIATILKATERGAALVKQILTFARKSEVTIDAVQVNYIIKELLSLLHQTFPKAIEFDVELDKNLPIISIDASQLDQALMNLCVNARDAILEAGQSGRAEGRISIRTSTASGAELRKRFASVVSDEYVCVSVTDTGIGMDEETKHRIFEPFFTTKEVGKGTGLGLAVVYGVMQAHQGIIDVQSQLGRGTTFSMYFPVPKRVTKKVFVEKSELLEVSGGEETILVIEDEEALRMLLKNLLQAKGYTILTASDGLEAVEMFEKNKSRISLIVSDHGLPGMNGAVAVKKMIAAKPEVKCIMASGYIEPNQKSEIFKSGVKEFIQKPYDPMEVVKKVREVLDLK